MNRSLEGATSNFAWIEAALEQVREAHGHLEFRSRGVANPNAQKQLTKEKRA